MYYELNQVYSFEGYVIDCSLEEPESSFLQPTPEYTIEIDQPHTQYLEEELIEFFEEVANPIDLRTISSVVLKVSSSLV